MTAVWTGIALLAVLNCAVTLAVLLSRGLETSQKAYQILIVWLLPLVGALVCTVMLREPTATGDTARCPDAGAISGLGGKVFEGDSDGGHQGRGGGGNGDSH